MDDGERTGSKDISLEKVQKILSLKVKKVGNYPSFNTYRVCGDSKDGVMEYDIYYYIIDGEKFIAPTKSFW